MGYPPVQGYILVPAYSPAAFGPRKKDSGMIWVIVTIIVVVALFFGVNLVLFFLVSGLETPSTGPVPLGSALDVGSAQVGSGPAPTVWYENVSILSSSTGLILTSLSFAVENGTGVLVRAPATSAVDLVSPTGIPMATFSLSSSSWNDSSGGLHPAAGDTFQLQWVLTSSKDLLTGDEMVIGGSDGYEGTINVDLA